jgi:hypothetical protein
MVRAKARTRAYKSFKEFENDHISLKNVKIHYNYGKKYGATQKEICERFNISKGTLRKIFDYELEEDTPIYRKRINSEDIKEMVAQYQLGMPIFLKGEHEWQNSIAGYHGVSESTIREHLRASGVYRNEKLYNQGPAIIEDLPEDNLKGKIQRFYQRHGKGIKKAAVVTLVAAGLVATLAARLGHDSPRNITIAQPENRIELKRQEKSIDDIFKDYNHSIVDFCKDNNIPSDPLVRAHLYESLGLGEYSFTKNAEPNKKLSKSLIALRQNDFPEFIRVVRDASIFHEQTRNEVNEKLEARLAEHGLTRNDINPIYKLAYGGNRTFCGDLHQKTNFLEISDEIFNQYKSRRETKAEIPNIVIAQETPKIVVEPNKPTVVKPSKPLEVINVTQEPVAIAQPVQPIPYVAPVQRETPQQIAKTYTQEDIREAFKVKCEKITPNRHSLVYEVLDETILFNVPEMVEVGNKTRTAKYSNLRDIANAGSEIFGDAPVVQVFERDGLEFYRLPKDINGNAEITDIWQVNTDFNGVRVPASYLVHNDRETRRVHPENPKGLINFNELGERVNNAEANAYIVTPQHHVGDKKHVSGLAFQTERTIREGTANLGQLELTVQNPVYCTDRGLNGSMFKSALKVIGAFLGLSGGNGVGSSVTIPDCTPLPPGTPINVVQ